MLFQHGFKLIRAGVFFLNLAILISCSKAGDGDGSNPPTPPPPSGPAWDVNALRGTWVTTTASTALDSRENIRNCVQICKAAGINNIFMVVYNNARTIYPSAIMNNLIGKPILEKFTGRDPLKEMVEEAHAAGLKVHAWFEYGFSSSYSASGGAIIAAKPQWASRDINGNLVVKNGFDWLNGFHPEVQQYMVDLFKEVINNYDVDGVQGDDRLPAMPSSSGYDVYTVNLYKSENGGYDPPGNPLDPNWINWRTKKMNAFMKRLYTEIKTLKPSIQVTMSPSPYPWGRDEYLQDWPAWVDSGWADIVIPQCYRYDLAAYTSTITQQKSYYRNTKIPLYPGVLLQSGSYVATDVFLSQMIQANRNTGYKGEVFFFYEGIPKRTSWFTGQYPFIK